MIYPHNHYYFVYQKRSFHLVCVMKNIDFHYAIHDPESNVLQSHDESLNLGMDGNQYDVSFLSLHHFFDSNKPAQRLIHLGIDLFGNIMEMITMRNQISIAKVINHIGWTKDITIISRITSLTSGLINCYNFCFTKM